MPRIIASIALAAAVTAAAGDPIGILKFADADGQTIALNAPGVLYLVDFWALGCKPCILEVPDLERLAKEYEPGGRFRFVSVAAGGWKGKSLLSVAERAEMTLPVYSDPEDWLGQLEINAFPTKLLIRDGEVLRRARGGGIEAYATWKKAIDAVLGAPSVTSSPQPASP